jgi:hypothetical protein
VFAGLHQVQRFHDSSNTPVAHGGNDILSRRDLPRGGGRILIKAGDVESVYAKREVRDLVV